MSDGIGIITQMALEETEWWAVFAGADICGVLMTDGPFCSREMVEKLYNDRIAEGNYRYVYLVKIEKGL